MGLFTVPTLQRNPHGILALVLGILLSGLGLLIAGLIAKSKDTWMMGLLIIVVQIVLYILGFVIGFGLLGMLVWVFAIVWSILIFMKST
jgi:hypothetical protein